MEILFVMGYRSELRKRVDTEVGRIIKLRKDLLKKQKEKEEEEREKKEKEEKERKEKEEKTKITTNKTE